MRRLLVIVATTAIFAGPAHAQPQQRTSILRIHPHNPPVNNPHDYRHERASFPTPEKRAENLVQLLGLSSEQKDQVQAIFVDEDKQSTALWADTSLAPQARIGKLDELRDATVQKVRTVLNDDQRKKFDAIAPAKESTVRPRMEPDNNYLP